MVTVMQLEEFCACIGLHSAAAAFVRGYAMAEEEYRACAALYARDHETLIAEVRKRPDHEQVFLYLFVRLAVDCHVEYERRGISDRIYFDTFRDISIWEEEYRTRTGRVGVAEWGWLWLHPLLRIFRLGRLQFQPYAMTEQADLPAEPGNGGVTLRPGDLLLNVHIPKDGPLSPALTMDSYTQAKAFFRGVPPVFLCESWLLCPELPKLLKPDSNILAFQREYRLIRMEPGTRQAEERIFGEPLESPEQYPETTSLQKAAKKFLLSGGKLENGVGIRL